MNCVIVIRRVKDNVTGQSSRKVISVEEIKNPTTFNTIFKWDPKTDFFESNIHESMLLQKIAEQTGQTHEEILQEFETRTMILKWMQERDIRDYKGVAETIGKYYHEPKLLTQKIENGV